MRYAVALGVVALLLVGLSAATRLYARGRLRVPRTNKTIEVLESVTVTQQVSVHVVTVSGRRYLIGTAGAAVTLLAKLPRDRAA